MRAAVGWSSSDSTGRSVDPRNPAFRRPGSFPSSAERCRALAAAVAHLRCPSCASPVYLGGSNLVCNRGHIFDIARHGYANLTWLRLAAGEEDQLARLASFRSAHPEVVIGDLGFGKVWQARTPEDEADGESVITRYTLRELLDQLAVLFPGS